MISANVGAWSLPTTPPRNMQRNALTASLKAPCWSARPRWAFRQASSPAPIGRMTRKKRNVEKEITPADQDGCSSCRVHGPMIRKKTGWPRYSAVSTLNKSFGLVSQEPVHAACVSYVPWGWIIGWTRVKRLGSRPAAMNSDPSRTLASGRC